MENAYAIAMNIADESVKDILISKELHSRVSITVDSIKSMSWKGIQKKYPSETKDFASIHQAIFQKAYDILHELQPVPESPY